MNLLLSFLLGAVAARPSPACALPGSARANAACHKKKFKHELHAGLCKPIPHPSVSVGRRAAAWLQRPAVIGSAEATKISPAWPLCRLLLGT